MAQDYNKTLNLPTTEFNMRGALPQREPGWVKDWQDKQLYHKMIKNNEGKPLYILHDGPPYANGDIHLGTALNKVLKDFIIRQKNMSGYQAPYVPGWDTHGLPIELKARKKAGVTSDISPVELQQNLQGICPALSGYPAQPVHAPGRFGRVGKSVHDPQAGV